MKFDKFGTYGHLNILTPHTLKFGVVTTSLWRSQVRALEDPQAEIDWNIWNPTGFTIFAVVVVSVPGMCGLGAGELLNQHCVSLRFQRGLSL